MRVSRVFLSGAVVVGALVSSLTTTPVLQTVFGLLALANVAELLSRLAPDKDPVARGLLAVMGLLVLAIVLGLILNEMPGQLTRMNWAIGWAVTGVALTVLTAATNGAASDGAVVVSPPMVATMLFVVAGTAGGFVLAWQGQHHMQRQPLLALSAPWHSSNHARIVVQAVSIAGHYAIRVLPDGEIGRGAEPTSVTLRSGVDESVTQEIALPAARTHWTVLLTTGGMQPQVERKLILWKSNAAHQRGSS